MYLRYTHYNGVRVRVFNAISTTFQLVLLVEETGEHHRHVVCHWQTLSHNVISSTPHHARNSNSQL